MAGDFREWLGAVGGEPRDITLTIFVPSQTRDGKAIDHEYWRIQALTQMARLFGGATAVEATGAWRDDEQGAAIKLEQVAAVVSLTPDSAWNEEAAVSLGVFLRRMGRETNQGEVGLIVNGEYLPIREFKP